MVELPDLINITTKYYRTYYQVNDMHNPFLKTLMVDNYKKKTARVVFLVRNMPRQPDLHSHQINMI